ncbi:energy transducer TonB [Aliiglaciecola lipolytica]|uniref:TonB C-terminal domain-containing protein n=1 Tax=Aliiglaciecola lipolytica E3 TaxID=1127673 RepID=K6YN20_9ALTE|nr:hypothetical protein [Aliiglaciecola lipolytica]GAC12740.1 hypothetical protein GLIP_0085 [Aliiglaciecola lipolytica E3]
MIFTSIFKRFFIAPLVASLLIAGLVSLALSILSQDASQQATLTVRKVNLAVLPPPPKPKSQQQKSQVDSAPDIQLNVDGGGVNMEFQITEALQDMAVTELPEIKVQNSQNSLVDILNFDWQAFGLSDLDETPRLLTDLKVRFPESLKRKGVRSAEVELAVLIDEHGGVLLKNIIRNQYPELNTAIKKLISQARFSIPKKDGVAVQASFNWPLEFADS